MRGGAQSSLEGVQGVSQRRGLDDVFAPPTGRNYRAAELYAPEIGATRRDEGITGSALFAYKLNWQTVLFLGYSDDRALSVDDRLEPAGRALFFKISYAFQR